MGANHDGSAVTNDEHALRLDAVHDMFSFYGYFPTFGSSFISRLDNNDAEITVIVMGYFFRSIRAWSASLNYVYGGCSSFSYTIYLVTNG